MITVTKMAKFYTKFNIQIFGGARRDRTADLNTASVALSQLSYSPKSRDARLRLRRIGVKPNTLLLSL